MITPEQAKQELARRELARRGIASPPPVSRKPYEPSTLENVSGAISSGLKKVSPIMQKNEEFQDVIFPQFAPLRKGFGMATQAADIVGGELSEKLGKKQYNPYLSATAGMIAANAPFMVGRSPAGVLEAASSIPAKAIGGASKAGMSLALGPTVEAISKRLENPSVVSSALTHPQLAEKLPSTISNIQSKITSARQKAVGYLRNSTNPSEGGIPRAVIQNLLGDLSDSLKIKGVSVGQGVKSAQSSIGSLVSDIGKILEPKVPAIESEGILGPGGKAIKMQRPEVFVSEKDVKDIVDRVGKDINWDDKAASQTNESLTNFQVRLNNFLKSKNDKFAKAMKPVDSLMRLYTDLIDSFSLNKKTGEGIAPTDTTISKLASLPQERKAVSQNVMRRTKAVTGEDYLEKSKLANIRKQFEGGRANGSRRVNLGSIVGGATGAGFGALVGHSPGTATVGATVGGIAGAIADSFGGQIAAKFIDTYSSLSKKAASLGQTIPAEAIRRTALALVLNDLADK